MRDWTKDMARQIQQSLAGGKRLEMPKGRLQVLLLELRRMWECVWNGYLLDRKNKSLLLLFEE